MTLSDLDPEFEIQKLEEFDSSPVLLLAVAVIDIQETGAETLAETPRAEGICAHLGIKLGGDQPWKKNMLISIIRCGYNRVGKPHVVVGTIVLGIRCGHNRVDKFHSLWIHGR